MLGERALWHVRDLRLGLMGASFLVVVVAIIVRIKMVRLAAETLQTQPNDSAALVRWRTGIIASFVLAETIMLFGFALRFFGGTLLQVTPFYAVAIALMLLWWPRLP
jgi:F0F1-type ATP synthase membrane subunit c/vacuolar-type H+-ATPase subunit K